MPITLPPKDPNAILDYGVDWNRTDRGQAGWLGTDTIVTSTWTVPAGIVKTAESNTTTTTTVWLSGGTAGQVYSLVNRITTAEGRTDERTIQVPVRER